MVSFLTDTVVCGFSLYHILAYFLIYSCIGWCLEVIYAAATTGQLVNRGFLNGPVCPIYGFGMIIVLFALTPLQHSILLLYIGGVILPSALELAGGWALYKIYHTRWWDYSDFPFNIGGYICLEFCLLWGVGTLVVMRIVHPVVADLVDLIPPFVGVILMCFLYAVYAADVVATAIAASALADTLDTMEQLGDSIHAVSDAMTQLLGTTTLNADKKLDEGRLQFKLAAAEARQEQANSLAPEREQLTADISRLDDLLKKSGEADEAEKKMRATEQEISSIQEEMTSNQAKQEHCQKEQEELSGLLEDTKQEASRADAEEAELNAKSSLFERLRQLSEGIEELSKLQKAADTARTVLARKSEAADNAVLEFSGLQAKYYAGEAARLAKKLEKGAKCPVCGSTEHPFPAAWTDEIPSQQQLDKAEADSAKAARAKSAAERDLAEREGSLTAHRANVSRDYLSLMGVEFPENGAAEAVSEKTEAVGKQLDEASIRLEGCQWAQLRIESLEKQLSAQKEIQDSLAERQEKLKNEASALQSRHAAEEATLNEKRAGLEGRDMDRLRRDKADKIARGSEIDSMMKSAADKLAAASRNAASSASLRSTLEGDIERTQKEFSEAEETLCMQISRCGFADEQELAANYVRISALQSLRAEISEHDKSVSAARARLDECEQRLPEDRTPRSTEEFDEAEKVLSAELEERKQRLMKLGTELDRYASAARELSNIISASGESLRTYAVLEKLERAICGKGAERIAFETFIQMRMFKGVLQRANDRLKVMSGGRYEFELRTQNVRGNASEGLDINMIDNNSSRTRRRDVSTLSGGERFMASFALAIGLSDYTLQRGGNKQSDMLFVDEGFSSLDSSTFEMALNVIQGISAGRRMIGLVTHIDGIKQYFRESQIYVHKGKAGEGSTIEVKCGVHKNM